LAGAASTGGGDAAVEGTGPTPVPVLALGGPLAVEPGGGVAAIGPVTVTVGPTRMGALPRSTAAANVTDHVPAGRVEDVAHVPAMPVPETSVMGSERPATEAETSTAGKRPA
jgi:hypothetical protein